GGTPAPASPVLTVDVLESPPIPGPPPSFPTRRSSDLTASGVSLGTPSIGDNCPGATVSNDAPASFAKGSTTVTWTVTDASGNTATASQVVTVEDRESPTITAPAAVKIGRASCRGRASGVGLGTPSNSNNCP